MVRRAVVFVLAVAAMAVFATVAATVVSQAGRPLADQASVAVRNIAAVAPILAAVIAPFALAFFVLAGLMLRFAWMRRLGLYAIAGAASVTLVTVALSELVPVVLTGAGRMQEAIGPYALAGAFGGAVYGLWGPRSRLTG